MINLPPRSRAEFGQRISRSRCDGRSVQHARIAAMSIPPVPGTAPAGKNFSGRQPISRAVA
jgi:hypothetical protein